MYGRASNFAQDLFQRSARNCKIKPAILSGQLFFAEFISCFSLSADNFWSTKILLNCENYWLYGAKNTRIPRITGLELDLVDSLTKHVTFIEAILHIARACTCNIPSQGFLLTVCVCPSFPLHIHVEYWMVMKKELTNSNLPLTAWTDPPKLLFTNIF